MSAWWDDDHELLLLTPAELAQLPDGEVLTAIDGDTAIKGTDYIDDDTRFGHLAFGVVGDHPLRLAKLAAQGMSAGTAKTEGLGATPASPVAESDAPKPNQHIARKDAR